MRWDAREQHALDVPASVERTWRAARAVTVGDVRLLRPLMLLRVLPARLLGRKVALDSGRPLLDVFLDNGFVLLEERAPEEIVIGAIGEFWSIAGNAPIRSIRDAADFTAFSDPGFAKAALNLRIVPQGAGARVLTETRVVGTNPDGRRGFRLYWMVIRWPSGAIRRSWLHAIRRRALRAMETAA
jgi:hypothetical protein